MREHCLDVWGADLGFRRVVCESQLAAAHQSHFARPAWTADGTSALLDNGTIVTRDGELAGRAPLAADNMAFQVQWEPDHARVPGLRNRHGSRALDRRRSHESGARAEHRCR